MNHNLFVQVSQSLLQFCSRHYWFIDFI